MKTWVMISAGVDRWYVTNGHCHLQLHPTYDGSGRKEKYPDGVIVSADQAREYAEKIAAALNAAGVEV